MKLYNETRQLMLELAAVLLLVSIGFELMQHSIATHVAPSYIGKSAAEVHALRASGC